MTTFLEETMREFDETFQFVKIGYAGKARAIVHWGSHIEGDKLLKSFISSRLTLQRKEMREMVLELVQKYHDTKYHNDAEKALSDIINALDKE